MQNLQTLFSNIATAIRSKTGKNSTIVASNFPSEIETITTPKQQAKSINVTYIGQVVTYDSAYNGLSQVTVAGVSPSIDSNIIPSNIKAGATILGVSGTAPLTFATVEELNAHTNLAENTLAIVYGTSYVGTYKLDSGVWTQIGDTTEELEIFEDLAETMGYQDEYEGTGGTDEEINTVLDEIIGGSV